MKEIHHEIHQNVTFQQRKTIFNAQSIDNDDMQVTSLAIKTS